VNNPDRPVTDTLSKGVTMPRNFRQLIHTLTGPAHEPAEPNHPTVVVEYDALFQLPQGVERTPL
jgi:hypothetical protein